MPIAAIGIAVGSLALGGGAAIGAVVAGTATLATTLTAVATIGAVTSAVGAVTGSKALQTAGLVMGAVGGVGALAANAGLLGEGATTESLFGGAESAGGVTAPDITPDIGTIDASTPDISASLDKGGDFVSAINSDSSPASAASQTAQAAAPATGAPVGTTGPGGGVLTAGKDAGVFNDFKPEVSTAQSGLINTGAQPTASTGALPPSQAAVPQGAGAVPTAPGVATPTSAAPGTPTAPAAGTTTAPTPASTGTFGNLLAFANKNPIVAYSAINAAGSLVSGMFNPVTPAQVSALNSQAAANNATAAQTSQQTANMKQGVPVATRAPSNTDLINTAPVKSSDVTGIAA
jgi:hypothetical protein